jgi:acyl-CoA dehydrogenase
MDWSLPADVTKLLDDIDTFIEAEIKPLERDNPELFDHRKEFARTDIERGGVPTRRWRDMLAEARRRFDAAGFYRYALPKELGGQAGSNVAMAMVREHLAGLGPGLHAELAHEQSVVGNLAQALLIHEFGTAEQKERYLEDLITGDVEMAFGLTEPNHGSDVTWLETTARQDGDDWVISGAKRFNSLLDVAQIDLVFARTSGQPGKAEGITAFIVPVTAPGFEVEHYLWTLVMPTEHAQVKLENVRVPKSAVLGEVGRGLDCAQLFVHENRIRQSASSLGAAQFCVDRSVKFCNERIMFGKPLRDYQGIQWQLVKLQTQAELVRNTVYRVAWEMDQLERKQYTTITDRVSMCNYSANQLACDAADRAIQIHGGMGYTRHLPFESIYRHHRRYRLTEGSDEIQLRRIAAGMFDFSSSRRS